METYCQAREAERNKEAAEKEIKEAKERKAKEAARTRIAAKSAETAAKRQKKEEEKLARAMQRAASAQIRASRATENASAKSKRDAQIKNENEAKNKKISKGKASTPSSADPAAEAKDPRSYIPLDELVMMSSKRGLPGLGRTKEQLISGLQEADDEYSLGDLKKMCQAKSFDNSGDKKALKFQLALAAAKSCGSFEAGVNAAKAAGEDRACEKCLLLGMRPSEHNMDEIPSALKTLMLPGVYVYGPILSLCKENTPVTTSKPSCILRDLPHHQC